MKNKNDLFISIVLLAFSIIIFAITFSFPYSNELQLRPALMPRIEMVLLFVLATVLLIMQLNNKFVSNAKTDWTKLMINIAIWIAFISIVHVIGFIISFGLLLSFYLFYYGKEKMSSTSRIAIIIISMITLYLVLIVGLKIPLPEPWL
jgi:hypothetical protein